MTREQLREEYRTLWAEYQASIRAGSWVLNLVQVAWAVYCALFMGLCWYTLPVFVLGLLVVEWARLNAWWSFKGRQLSAAQCAAVERAQLGAHGDLVIG